MKYIRKSKYHFESDIDILTPFPKEIKKMYEAKHLCYTPSLYSWSGYFMKKLTTKGLLVFHIQDEIFFTTEDESIIIAGFAQMILSEDKSYDYMLYMMKIYFEKKIKKRYIQEIEKAYNKPFYTIDIGEEIDEFINIHRLSLKKKRLKYSKWKKRFFRLKYFFYPRYIAITGLDGSGKSTALKSLKCIMQHNCTLVYMGKKEWRTRLAKRYLVSKKLPSVINIFILYGEFVYRYIYAFRQTKVILFDRYPSEMYLTQKGIRRVVYYLLFNLFFPKPSQVFYLHCPTQTAIKRKSDIEDVLEFMDRKEKFDKHYKDAIWIDTESNNRQQTIRKIIKNLNKKVVEIL